MFDWFCTNRKKHYISYFSTHHNHSQKHLLLAVSEMLQDVTQQGAAKVSCTIKI